MNRLVKLVNTNLNKYFIQSCIKENDFKSIVNFCKKHKQYKIIEFRDFNSFEEMIQRCNNHNILPY